VFLVALAAWVVGDLRSERRVDIPTPLPIGSAFEGNEQVPVEEFKAKYQNGIALLDKRKASVSNYKGLHSIADWLGVFLTSAITLIVGLAGRVPSEKGAIAMAEELARDAGQKQAIKGRYLKVAVNCLGLLAALASISIVLSNRCEAQMRSNVESAVELNSVLSKARSSWFSAKDADEAQQVLGQLESDLIKRQ
jgi:hypothetical protein